METINKRFACFLSKAGNLHLVHWTNDCGLENSHRALTKHLTEKVREEGDHLNYNCRYCGFYADVEGNGITHRFYYGESSDYHHLYADDADDEYEIDPDEEFTPSIEVAKRLKEFLNKKYENDLYAQIFFESFLSTQYIFHKELGQWL